MQPIMQAACAQRGFFTVAKLWRSHAHIHQYAHAHATCLTHARSHARTLARSHARTLAHTQQASNAARHIWKETERNAAMWRK